VLQLRGFCLGNDLVVFAKLAPGGLWAGFGSTFAFWDALSMATGAQVDPDNPKSRQN
jgi:hypothetical protein